VLLGPEERGVGAPQGLVARRRGLEVAQPDRHRRAQPVAQRRLGYRAPRAVRAQQRLMAIALDEDDAVGVAAHPREDVLLAHDPAQQRPDLDQDLVGGIQAGAVVELAEVVDVDEGDGQRAVVAQGAGDLLGQALAKARWLGRPVSPSIAASVSRARAILGVGHAGGDEVGVVWQALVGPDANSCGSLATTTSAPHTSRRCAPARPGACSDVRRRAGRVRWLTAPQAVEQAAREHVDGCLGILGRVLVMPPSGRAR
jgi:hypothetical protein